MSSPDLLTRRLAVEIFDAVLRHNKGLEDEYSSCMERQEQNRPLENRDRTFVRLLVTVMLRRLGQIDDIIKRFLKKPLPDKACCVQDILRIGTAQLVFLDTVIIIHRFIFQNRQLTLSLQFLHLILVY